MCKGKTDLFFPESGDHQSAQVAKNMCLQDCPVTVRCLVRAVESNDDKGIRGGLGENQRRRLRRNYKQIMSGKVAGGLDRFERLAEVTVHLMRDGNEPEWIKAQNTDGVTHGRIATWNRSCRCHSCSAASAAVSYARKVLGDDMLTDIKQTLPHIVVLVAQFKPAKEPKNDWEDQAAKNEARYKQMQVA